MNPDRKPSFVASRVESAVRNCCTDLEDAYKLKPEKLFAVASLGLNPQFRLYFFYANLDELTPAEETYAYVDGIKAMEKALDGTAVRPFLSLFYMNPQDSKIVDDYFQRVISTTGSIVRAKEITL